MSKSEIQIPRKIITCTIMGGLGNQLFQIATTISYAIRMKCVFLFPYSIEVFKNRFTYWDSFLSSLRSFTTDNPKFGRTNIDLNYLAKYPERTFHFNPIPPFDRSVCLHGYFQSYLYFEKEKEAFFKMIHLREQQEKVRQENSHYFDSNSDPITVSLHFRIGDYTLLPEYHPILPSVYYEKALIQLVSKLPPPKQEMVLEEIRILYCCEEKDHSIVLETIMYLKSRMESSYRFVFVKVSDDIEDWKQMLIMSLCNHHIIANSTFSWWSAYFHYSVPLIESESFVLYPSVWFGPALQEKNVLDLFPKQWIRIDV